MLCVGLLGRDAGRRSGKLLRSALRRKELMRGGLFYSRAESANAAHRRHALLEADETATGADTVLTPAPSSPMVQYASKDYFSFRRESPSPA